MITAAAITARIIVKVELADLAINGVAAVMQRVPAFVEAL
jgi:hypothetical protein